MKRCFWCNRRVLPWDQNETDGDGDLWHVACADRARVILDRLSSNIVVRIVDTTKKEGDVPRVH